MTTNGSVREPNSAVAAGGMRDPTGRRHRHAVDRDRAVADELARAGVGQPHGGPVAVEDARRATCHPAEHLVELGHRGELARQLEQRLRALRLTALRLVELGVHERDGRVAGEHLEQPDVVRRRTGRAPAWRCTITPTTLLPVPQRDGEQRLCDLRGAGDVVADAAVGRVPREERLSGLGHVAGDADAHLRREHVERRPGSRRQLAAEGDRPQVVTLPQEHAAVVVVDQLAQLVGDRLADLRHVVEAAQLGGDAVQHLQVGDRADVVAPHGRRLGTLALVLVEDDDAALAARLGGHHRELGAGDELARVGRVLGAECDPDRDAHPAGGVELRHGDALGDALCQRVRGGQVARAHDHRELLAADAAHVVALAYHRPQDVGELGQHVVADGVAVDVVDALEVVQVEHHERDGRLLGARPQQLAAQALVEGAVVPEAGERIRLGLQLPGSRGRARCRARARPRRRSAPPGGTRPR